MQFVHLSDLHIHSTREKNAAIEALLQNIAIKHPQATLLATGDITDDGKELQYKEALRLLGPWKDRIALCPGNHDFGWGGILYQQDHARYFDQLLCKGLGLATHFASLDEPFEQVFGNVHIASLNSNLETLSPFDFACGEIGSIQLERLRQIIDRKQPGRQLIILLHHHPFLRNEQLLELKDAAAFRSITETGCTVLFGHRHIHGLVSCRLGKSAYLAGGKAEKDGMYWILEADPGGAIRYYDEVF